MPQVFGKNRNVEGPDPFFVKPTLAARAILVQLLNVWPTGHLDQERDPGNDKTRQWVVRLS